VDEHLPLLDLTPLYSRDPDALDHLTAEVDRCLISDGFLLVVGHQVPPQLRTDARDAALRFFHLPAERKQLVHVDDRRGWLPVGHEATGYASGEQSLADLKETYTIGHEPVAGYDSYRANRWTAEVDEFREIMTRYFNDMLRFGADMMRLFALTLGIAEDYLTRLADHPDSEFNVNWYPAQDVVGPAAPGQFRIGPHADYGCFTMLDRQAGVGGLQIKSMEGTWIDAPMYEGSYTINVGDLLARMTGDRWRSTPHRVLPPPADVPSEELLSLVFFHEFDGDAQVETLPPPAGGGVMHEPVVADEYIAGKYADVTL
jgi:isopenicillin N synthase-like dioxygenase